MQSFIFFHLLPYDDSISGKKFSHLCHQMKELNDVQIIKKNGGRGEITNIKPYLELKKEKKYKISTTYTEIGKLCKE